MRDIDYIEFTELDSEDEVIAIVRQEGSVIAVALSIKGDGDLETFMSVDTAARLRDALGVAIASARGDHEAG